MKNLLSLAVMLTIFGISACSKKEKTADLTLNFTAKFNNQNLVLKSEYIDSASYKYKIEKFKYFLSNIALVKDDNTEVKLTDLVCVDYETPSTQTLVIKNIPVTHFKKVKFGVGLTAAQNNMLPDDVADSDPRHVYSSMYWGWLKYIFVRMEGRSDVDGSNKFDNLLIYDVGSDELYKTVEILKSLNIAEGNNTLTFRLDIDKIFRNGTDGIDISYYEQSYTHSDKTNSKNYDTAIKFAENFSKAFTIE